MYDSIFRRDVHSRSFDQLARKSLVTSTTKGRLHLACVRALAQALPNTQYRHEPTQMGYSHQFNAPTMTIPHITKIEALRQLYAPASERALKKELPSLDPHASRFIALSPFVVLASSDAHGHMDASPRGGEPGFVKVLNAQTVLIPDAPGNNRLDTLENIVSTGRLGLLFMVPGFDETLRINGQAVLSTAPADLALCVDARRTPKLVIRVTVDSVYLHCAKALMRSQLWDASLHPERSSLPHMGEMLRDQIQAFKGETVEIESQAEMVQRYQQSL